MEHLRLLSWAGYREILEGFSHSLKQMDIVVTVTEDINADRILRRFVAQREHFDIVIVDWEYRELYGPHILDLDPEIIKFSGYLKPFQKRFWFEIGNRLAFVPLRFGTNGFLLRRNSLKKYEKFETSLFNQLEQRKNDNRKARQTAIWDWWLPNMLLLGRAAGFDPPEEMTGRQLQELEKTMLRLLSEVMRRGTEAGGGSNRFFQSLPDIINNSLYEKSSSKLRINWMLGPSEMIVAPVRKAKYEKNELTDIDWDIPSEGGLVWLETAALSVELKHESKKKRAAYSLLSFLQSEYIQRALMCGHFAPRFEQPTAHWSYSFNEKYYLDLDDSIVNSFGNSALSKGIFEFNDWVSDCINKRKLFLRSLPDDIRPWQEAWTRMKNRCMI